MLGSVVYDFRTPTRLGTRLGPGEEHDRHFVCTFTQRFCSGYCWIHSLEELSSFLELFCRVQTVPRLGRVTLTPEKWAMRPGKEIRVEIGTACIHASCHQSGPPSISSDLIYKI